MGARGRKALKKIRGLENRRTEAIVMSYELSGIGTSARPCKVDQL